jgi:hypothetical protein
VTYTVVYMPDAETGLDRLPPMVASKVMDEVDKLECDDPYELLEPWYYLFRPVGWYYRFAIDEVEAMYFFHLGIEVNPHRRQVLVVYIGVQIQPRRPPPPDDVAV